MTHDPCHLKAHYERAVIEQKLDEWATADPHARHHYDVVQCWQCGRFMVRRRPDFGDAA